MAIEVKLTFEDDAEPKTGAELLKAYNEAKEKQKFESTNEALESKRNRIIDALNNATDNQITLNASLRKQVIKIVEAYEYSEQEVNAEHVRLNPSLRKKRAPKK